MGTVGSYKFVRNPGNDLSTWACPSYSGAMGTGGL
jgi:hypothetical protein